MADQAEGYARISTEAARDARLSFKAKGILAYLASLPGARCTSVKSIAAACMEGETSVRSGLLELEAAGYITWRRGAIALMDGVTA